MADTTGKTDITNAGGVDGAARTAALAAEAAALATAARESGLPDAVGQLLEWGVAKPLREREPAGAGPDAAEESFGDRLEALAEQLTAQWLAGGQSDPTLALAAASLQAARRLLPGPFEEWTARLAALTADTAPTVTVVPGGPLVVSGPLDVSDHLGCSVDVAPVAALCRCGGSELKPGCDATCLRTGFDDARARDRVADRRDTYVGQQVTVFDNRGICQHSGLCTDRLSTVFHADSEPFVTPSGGRMDEIIRAVRDCPSGALSYALDGVEARDGTDWGGSRPAAVHITRDGPYRVTGPVTVVDGEGRDARDAEGASLEHCALCRCGKSRNKPFCSGMHWYSDFRAPENEAGVIPSVFEWAGGLPALTRMTRIFYERYVPEDELLGPLFSRMSADHPERVAKWLGEVFGGPACYSGEYGGYSRMLGEHRGRSITPAQRARWVELLTRSAHDAGLPDDAEFRAAFGSYIEWGSRLAFENSQPGAQPPPEMPMPHWDWSTAAGPPGSRPSALAPAEDGKKQEPAPTLPAPGEPVGFDAHVRPLFRDRDRRSMLFVFDLWSLKDVRTHATAILDRLRAGTMPCDGTWPQEWVAVLERWIDEGMAE